MIIVMWLSDLLSDWSTSASSRVAFATKNNNTDTPTKKSLFVYMESLSVRLSGLQISFCLQGQHL